jgi:hypothetical protein
MTFMRNMLQFFWNVIKLNRTRRRHVLILKSSVIKLGNSSVLRNIPLIKLLAVLWDVIVLVVDFGAICLITLLYRAHGFVTKRHFETSEQGIIVSWSCSHWQRPLLSPQYQHRPFHSTTNGSIRSDTPFAWRRDQKQLPKHFLYKT